MRTEELINQLASDASPATTLERTLLYGVIAGLGWALMMVVVIPVFGLRPDLHEAFFTAPFWMKWTYTAAIALSAWLVVTRIARPGRTPGRTLWLTLLPLLVLVLSSVPTLRAASPEVLRAMWLGHSALMCPWLIVVLSLPVQFALAQALRRAAPTEHRSAGFSAGLLAGALAAFVYCLACTENGAPFVATWYSLGILLSAGLGALLGPMVLRWR